MTTEHDANESLELIRRAKNDDQEALGQLIDRYRDRLLARIRLMMGDQARRVADSGDFLQGMFVQVIQGLDRFEAQGDQAFLRWATQIARNNIRDGVRKKRESAFHSFSNSGIVEPAQPDDQRSPRSELVLREESFQLAEALESLPPDDCRIIELRDIEGLSYRDIAEQMDKPTEAAAQMHHARAISRLMKRLSEK